jgi:hypothetical protein
MYPQDNPYMVKTQTLNGHSTGVGKASASGASAPGAPVQEGRLRKASNPFAGEFEIEAETGPDVADLYNKNWIYFKLDKSCDNGFWHDTADTIVAHFGQHLHAFQKTRLQNFVLAINKHIFKFGPLEKPSFEINRSKDKHVVKVNEKYHVIVRKEQNTTHIFACVNGADYSVEGFETGELKMFKECTKEYALGSQKHSKDADDSESEDWESQVSRSSRSSNDPERLAYSLLTSPRTHFPEAQQSAERSKQLAAAETRHGQFQVRGRGGRGPVEAAARSVGPAGQADSLRQQRQLSSARGPGGAQPQAVAEIQPEEEIQQVEEIQAPAAERGIVAAQPSAGTAPGAGGAAPGAAAGPDLQALRPPQAPGQPSAGRGGAAPVATPRPAIRQPLHALKPPQAPGGAVAAV